MGAAATIIPRRSAPLVLIPFLLVSCQVTPGVGRVGGWDRAISDKPELWGAYHPQGVYEVQRDVFLLDVVERTNGPALVPGMDSPAPPGTFRGPTGIEDYKSQPESWRTILGLVPAGTRLRVEVLRGKGNLRDSEATVHYVKGRLMEGEYRGRLVDLQAVSLYVAVDPESHRVTLSGPNEDFLAPAP